jgi:hypothetical protein
MSPILLELTGAFLFRWSLEKIGISLKDIYLLLFSIWGSAAFPAAMRLGIRRHNRSKMRSRFQRGSQYYGLAQDASTVLTR